MLTAAKTTAKMAEHMGFGQQFNDEKAVAIQFKETMELIITFHNMFLATRDSEYIDTAIALAMNMPPLPECLSTRNDDLVLALTELKAGRIYSSPMGSIDEMRAESIGEGANTPMK